MLRAHKLSALGLEVQAEELVDNGVKPSASLFTGSVLHARNQVQHVAHREEGRPLGTYAVCGHRDLQEVTQDGDGAPESPTPLL